MSTEKTYADGLNDALAIIATHALAVDDEAETADEDDSRADQLEAVAHALGLVDESIRCLPGFAEPSPRQGIET
jgi:hypothetical protein